jgi:hypothetical protein
MNSYQSHNATTYVLDSEQEAKTLLQSLSQRGITTSVPWESGGKWHVTCPYHAAAPLPS